MKTHRAVLLKTVVVLTSAWALLFSLAGPLRAAEQENVVLVGHNDLQGREALQVTARSEPGNGEYVYVGFHAGRHANPLTGKDEFNGTMIIDISDPTDPTTVAHLPNSVEATARAVQVLYDYGPGNNDYLIRNHETETDVRKFEIFDITGRDQTPPLITKVGEITGTPEDSCGPGCGGTLQSAAHKGWWSPDSGLYYAAANEPGFRGGMDSSHLIIWNLEDVTEPSFVGRAWIAGQKLTEPAPAGRLNWHHPIVDEANQRLYGGYHRGGNVVSYDIGPILSSPRERMDPVLAWGIDTSPPGPGGTHTVVPITYQYPEIPNVSAEAYPRTYALVADEAGPQCRPIRHMFYVIDITDETNPFPVETWQVPDGHFCEKPGRFGPHQFAETVNGKLNTFEDRLVWVAYFNAGVRVLDVSNPYDAEEVGYYIPQPDEDRPISEQLTQINDVDIDHRGLVYASDRVGNGLYVLEYRGRP